MLGNLRCCFLFLRWNSFETKCSVLTWVFARNRNALHLRVVRAHILFGCSTILFGSKYIRLLFRAQTQCSIVRIFRKFDRSIEVVSGRHSLSKWLIAFELHENRNAMSVRHKRIPHDRLWQFSLIPLIITSAFFVVIRHTHASHLTFCVDRLKCISQVRAIYICISILHVEYTRIRIMRTTQQWAPYRAAALHASHAPTVFSTLHQQTHTDSIGLRCAAPSMTIPIFVAWRAGSNLAETEPTLSHSRDNFIRWDLRQTNKKNIWINLFSARNTTQIRFGCLGATIIILANTEEMKHREGSRRGERNNNGINIHIWAQKKRYMYTHMHRLRGNFMRNALTSAMRLWWCIVHSIAPVLHAT